MAPRIEANTNSESIWGFSFLRSLFTLRIHLLKRTLASTARETRTHVERVVRYGT